jgi:NAD-dependent deacetylase
VGGAAFLQAAADGLGNLGGCEDNGGMQLDRKDRLFVLTGAGVSAESGLATFRGSDPELVWRFYSMRRRDAMVALPNDAHRALAFVESQLGERFYLCTQNVDDLHERAGSKRVHHMHGSLFQSRCVRCDLVFADSTLYETAASLPTCTMCGSTVLLIVGTSGAVYPAAGFVNFAKRMGVRSIYVGPEEPLNAHAFDEIMLGTATGILPRLLGV